MKKNGLLLTGILLIQILIGKTQAGSNVKVLNLAESFSRKEEVNLSRFVNGIKYIKLETTSESMIGGYAQFEVTNDFVIVRQMGPSSKWQILLFDKATGKFLREIGKAGRGPGEFAMYSLIPFNPVKKEIYATDTRGNILIYNLNGVYTGKIVIPEFKKDEPVAFTSILDYDTFVMQVVNTSGSEKRKLLLLSSNGKTKTFPNKLMLDTTKIKRIISPPPWGFGNFYIWDNKTNFIELYCDTLYQITKNSMIPRYFFDWGKYNSPYSKQLWLSDRQHFYDYFYITKILENKSYIFVQTNFKGDNYTLFVEKANDKVTFCKTPESGVSGFHDDINGLMTVFPHGFTPMNEMVWIIQPVSLLKWLKEDSKRADKAYKKLLWLKDIDETSNPVIAIGKCK
jgi:hypothetical protein